MALVKGQCCPFKVVVKWDENGFYIDTKRSVPFHKYHPRSSLESMHIPTRLIPNEERENLIALAESCVGAGVGRNFLYSKLGKHLSNAKIAYIQNSAPKKPLHPSLKNSDIDELISFFKSSKEISYQVLWDVPTSVEKQC